jgi:hypothetical protein
VVEERKILKRKTVKNDQWKHKEGNK